MLRAAEELLQQHLQQAAIDAGHGINHARRVLNHAKLALQSETVSLSEHQQNAVLLAALLHDADDHKFFAAESQKAHEIVMTVSEHNTSLADLVQELINLVSASKNKNSTVKPEDEWMLIPRHADRLEAIGRIGIVRAYQYASAKGNPLSLPDTPRVTSMDELELIAPPTRFQRYDGNSKSMIDHFYDKIVHLGPIKTPNTYLHDESQRRMGIIYEFLFDFGQKGIVDTAKLSEWEALENEKE